ncbi:MAG: hypothetical protein A2Y17_00405 [Clostridiales bacterium GWF2_38_85]|nr:MAG: hypothetical protein A2Y17_00405 [Clostridiales bacterium GWF2_38_85]HBL83545.1 hypothetical protein [Clostridiales bacterium]
MAEFLEAVITELTQNHSESTLHQLLFKTSEKLIRGDEFSTEEKKYITDRFLNNISDKNDIERFHKIIEIPKDRVNMYPLFFVPSDSTYKRITVTGAMPKTHIFSANSYELEILRILTMWRSDDERVQDMIIKTIDRLKTMCLDKKSDKDEIYEVSIAVIRFIALVFPDEKQWIGKLFTGVRQGGKRTGAVMYYYFLMLSQLHLPMSDEEIRNNQWHFEKMTKIGTHRSYKLKYDNIFEPIRTHIARNCLLHFPEFEYLRKMKSYIGADGNKHFDDAY